MSDAGEAQDEQLQRTLAEFSDTVLALGTAGLHFNWAIVSSRRVDRIKIRRKLMRGFPRMRNAMAKKFIADAIRGLKAHPGYATVATQAAPARPPRAP